MDVLLDMGYEGPLYKNWKVTDTREALLRAQASGELVAFRGAVRAARLRIGPDDALVKSMGRLLKEAEWGVRICRQPVDMTKIGRVLTRLRELDMGPRLWEDPWLASAREEFAAWVVHGLEDSDAGIREKACKALGGIGEAAGIHAKTIAGCFEDVSWEVRRAACDALGRMGEPGAAACVAQLESSNAGVRKTSCEALGSMGHYAAPHAVALTVRLEDVDSNVRTAACLAFESMGSAGSAHAGAVASRLADEEADVRRTACQALASMGEAAEPYATAVTGRLDDTDPDVRNVARKALARLQGVGQAAPHAAGAS